MNLAEQNLQTIRNRISTIMGQLKQHQESVESKDISTNSIEDAHGLYMSQLGEVTDEE